jgi:protein-tyrosine phosphatase
MIAYAQRPSMFHCQGGRDRTGMTAAILLHILGVPQDTILADYVLSTKYLNERPAMQLLPQRQSSRKSRNTMPKSSNYSPVTSRPSFERSAKKYGSFERYRRDGLGLTDEEVRKLKSRLLE